MTTIAIDDKTVQKLQEIAERKGTTIGELTQEAIQSYLLEQKREVIRNETAAFQKMHPKLLKKYEGKYVAILNGKLIDSDSEQLPLYQRVSQQYPGETFLLKKVTTSLIETYTTGGIRAIALANNAEPILGRDVLNHFIVTLNGLASTVEISS